MASTKEWSLKHEDLLRILFYNPDTGIFTWQIDHASVQAGDRAGYLHKGTNYRRIMINGFAYLEHRLAFFYMIESWPVAELDHINGESGDNRWINLREATRQQNNRNVRRRKDNVTGFKGVSPYKGGKFIARIRVGGKSTFLGSFDTPEAASVAYEAAAKEQFGAFFPDKLN